MAHCELLESDIRRVSLPEYRSRRRRLNGVRLPVNVPVRSNSQLATHILYVLQQTLLLRQTYPDGALVNAIDEVMPPFVAQIADIQRAVASRYNISRDALLSDVTTMDVTLPRQVAMYLARTLWPRTYEAIGRQFGRRHYSTCCHAVGKIRRLRRHDKALNSDIEQIISKLKEQADARR